MLDPHRLRGKVFGGRYLNQVSMILVMVALLAGGLPAEPLAPNPLITVLEHEMEAGLARRGLREIYDQYQAYSSGRLDATVGDLTWRDKTGNCRLGWFDHLLRHQLQSPAQAELVSRQLFQALLGDHRGLGQALDQMAEKLDLTRLDGTPPPDGEVGTQLAMILAAAREAYEASLAPLSPAQRDDLQQNLYALTTAAVTQSAASFPDREATRRLCDLLEQTDRQALYAAARALAPLTDRKFLAALIQFPAGSQEAPAGVKGSVRAILDTPTGLIVVGGPGPNVYDLEALESVCAVIDLGGNDVYQEGTVSPARPVLVLIDLAGQDTYEGSRPGIQGGAVCGVSLLLDVAGNDHYEAQDVAQGACLNGVGLLIDEAGHDTYRALRRAHGSALGGLALLLDRAGDDGYHAALYAQGFGGPLGFGLMADLRGRDHYYAGGLYLDGYEDTPGYDGWSQGVGAGPRGVANGGIGVLLDGGGDDIYQCDYFSHGGGYWFAVGIARDFGGQDRRLGSTRWAYDGGPRQEPVFLRWGLGWQAHYGLGFIIDDAGDDTYGGTTVGLGFSWDVGVAGIIDWGGNDQYLVHSQGQGHQAGLGFLYDVGGKDFYAGDGAGNTSANITYHPLPDCGGNFGFAINYGGQDTYNGAVQDNVYLERSSPYGFLIDRPGVPSLEMLQAIPPGIER